MTVLRFLALSAVCAALAACENTKTGGSNDPYASNYGNDGHYNPYPAQSGYTTPSTPSYQTPPMPAEPLPPADPYAFSSPKKSTPPSVVSSPAPRKPAAKTTGSSSSGKKKSGSSTAKKKSTGGSRYTVSKGDTLYGIARKKGTTVAKIKAANSLSGDVIRPGQSLKIP